MDIWLAVVIGVATAGGGPGSASRLEELLARIRENESLYDNLEVRYTLKFEGNLAPREKSLERKSLDRIIHLQNDTVWAVWQSPLYFGRVEYDWEAHTGKKTQVVGEYGYDGVNTRRNYMGAIGSVSDRREHETAFCSPHRWGIQEFSQAASLADLFEGLPSAFGQWRPGERVVTEIVGEEEVAGVLCVKLRWRRFEPNGREGNSNYVTWIAPTRNYLAARHEHYLTYSSKVIPHAEYEAGNWKEIAPGVWLPFRSVSKLNDAFALRQGERFLKTHTTLTLEFARLDPKYGIDLFRNVSMPESGPVYTIKGGEVVKSEWSGRPPRDTSGVSRLWTWLIAANTLAFVALCVLYLIRHRQKARARGIAPREP